MSCTQKDKSRMALDKMQHCQVAASLITKLTTADAPESAVYVLVSCHVHVDACVLNCMHNLHQPILKRVLNNAEGRTLVCKHDD